MWASTTNRLVQLTRDGGAHWQKVTPSGIDKPRRFFMWNLRTSTRTRRFDGRHEPSVGPRADSAHARLWRHLATIVTGLPPDESVLVVREDPGAQGASLCGNIVDRLRLPGRRRPLAPTHFEYARASVTDIAVHGDDLAISTYGRGLWILDDIAPIRDLTPEMLAAPATSVAACDCDEGALGQLGRHAAAD